MKISIRELRRLIRASLREASRFTSRPVTLDPNTSNLADREEIGRNSIRDMDDPDELAPHLQEPVFDQEECWGPVPPVAPSPYVSADPYANDYHVIPSAQIKR